MMQPIIIRIPDEDRKMLLYEAQLQGVPVSQVARIAINDYLKDRPKKSGGEVLLEWAMRKEKIKTKTKISSTNYKKYLYGNKRKD